MSFKIVNQSGGIDKTLFQEQGIAFFDQNELKSDIAKLSFDPAIVRKSLEGTNPSFFAKDLASGKQTVFSIDSVKSLITSTVTIPQSQAFAFGLNGTTQYIDAGTFINPANLTAFSIEFWIRINTNNIIQTFVFEDGTGGFAQINFIIQAGNNLLLRIGSNGTDAITTATIALNTWTFLSITKDANGVTKIYINAVDKATGAAGTISAQTTSLQFGRNPRSTPSLFVSGDYDEISIWDKALTPTEISAHYNAGSGLKLSAQANLKQGFHLDEGSGTFLGDFSGNSFNGSAPNSGTWKVGKVPSTVVTQDICTMSTRDGETAGEFGVTDVGSSTGETKLGGKTSFKRSLLAVSTLTNHETIIGVDTTSAITVTLSDKDKKDGHIIFVKDEIGSAATNNITIDTEGSALIDGASTVIINTAFGSLRLYSDGVNWFTI